MGMVWGATQLTPYVSFEGAELPVCSGHEEHVRTLYAKDSCLQEFRLNEFTVPISHYGHWHVLKPNPRLFVGIYGGYGRSYSALEELYIIAPHLDDAIFIVDGEGVGVTLWEIRTGRLYDQIADVEHYDEDHQEFQFAMNFYEHRPDIQDVLIDMYFESGFLAIEEEFLWFDRVVTRTLLSEPPSMNMLRVKGRTLVELGDFNGALSYYRKALQLAKNATPINSVKHGRYRLLPEDTNGSVATFLVVTFWELALLYHRLGQTDHALQCFARADAFASTDQIGSIKPHVASSCARPAHIYTKGEVHVALLFESAIMLVEVGRVDEAFERFQASLGGLDAWNLRNARDCLVHMAQLHVNAHRSDAASADLTAAIRLTHGHMGHYTAGQVFASVCEDPQFKSILEQRAAIEGRPSPSGRSLLRCPTVADSAAQDFDQTVDFPMPL